MNADEKYVFFWNGPFSQWHHSEFKLDGCHFNTAEQAMMYLKAQLFDDKEIAQKILKTPNAAKQKALGRKVRGFDEAIWVENRENIVTQVSHAKYGQNKGLRRKLFQTGNKLLVEASPLDLIWGIGLDANKARNTSPSEWPGLNLLGNTLTHVRDDLRKTFPEEAKSVASDRDGVKSCHETL